MTPQSRLLRARAIQRGVVPFTVQVLAVGERKRADTFASSLNDRNARDGLISSAGFYSAGGFPATHPIAHVLAPSPAETFQESRPLTRVVVGAYFDAPSARVAASSLRSHGIPAFVRVL